LRSGWLPIHVTSAFLGDAIFALAFCTGVIYLIQERLVKSRRATALSGRLPSLEILDEINYRALTIGFPLLTIGIVTGAVWAEYAWGAYWNWDPKETWSLITWLLYAALLHQRLAIKWRGKKAAVMAIVGFGAVLFTFLGVNLLLEGRHTYAEWLR
jgi:cytochrome c-type biogenesis protein CcsB